MQSHRTFDNAARPALADRLLWERQFLPGPPFRLDVVYDQRTSHTMDGAALDAMPRVRRRDKDQTPVAAIGCRADPLPVGVVQISAPGLAARLVRKIDQHRKQLGADI